MASERVATQEPAGIDVKRLKAIARRHALFIVAITLVCGLGAVAAHVVLALASARASAPWVVMVAYLAGAWLCGAMGSAAHEYGHRLVRGG